MLRNGNYRPSNAFSRCPDLIKLQGRREITSAATFDGDAYMNIQITYTAHSPSVIVVNLQCHLDVNNREKSKDVLGV